MINSIFILQNQCPGDILMLTAAVRDLKLSHPNLRINVKTSAQYLWENNPYLDPAVTQNNAELVIKAEYPLINKSNTHPLHFIHGFRLFLQKAIGARIGIGAFKVDVHLSEAELLGKENTVEVKLPKRYWILNAGYKSDYTNKAWETARYAEVVDRLKDEVTFVQIGELNQKHTHPTIPGAIDLRGKTKDRKLLTLMYHASGVLTGVSYPMHLSTMQTDPEVCRELRPCVCIVGGREPITWVQQRNMQAMHCCGLLDCCARGGCWKSRIVPLGDGDKKDESLCVHPVITPSGQTVPLCMDLITVDDVVNKIRLCEKYSKR